MAKRLIFPVHPNKLSPPVTDDISGVNTGILNDKKQCPVHLATELNKVKALKIMGNYRELIDIQKGGEHGRTALHLVCVRYCILGRTIK